MNPDTGEIKEFTELADVPKGWVEWKKGQVVRIKNCWFEITAIIPDLDSIILTGISEEEGKGKQYLRGE